MSGFQGHGRDFSEYAHMRTDELEAILQTDFELPDDEESDMEKILYITEVIAKRRAGQPTGRYANADEAWDSFVENYCPEPEREVFLRNKAARTKKPWDWKRILVRTASIAAVLVLFVTVSTTTASAFGFNLWEWLAEWSREIFSVQDLKFDYSDDSRKIPEQLVELQEAMEEYGFPDSLIPAYLPDGYEMTELDCDATSSYVNLCVILENSSSDFIVFDYYMHLDDQAAVEVQKDDDNPDVYECGDVTHYIMTNYETYYTAWAVDNVECVISGFTSRGELTKVIRSIYNGG